MERQRWQRVDELFQAAIARAADERRDFLAKACGGDADLLRQIDRLVRAHERSHGLLETTIVGDALRIVAGTANADALTAVRPGMAFQGTDRFTVRRPLGAGGMGVVYEVHDCVRREVVALKTLLRAGATDIYRLKREFRSLVDVAHPNLVSLYELIVDGANCFFTMELVRGVNLVDYVRGPAPAASRGADQIRLVFRQLVDAIGVLHGRGKLHRDIKPSNILVTPDGRVVVLDFGLAGDIVPDDAAVDETMAGTPAYLAPERKRGTPATEAHDWYGVGVTLYEALTGRVPFEGSVKDVLCRKRDTDPRPPAEMVPDVPADLNALCIGLLHRSPAQRMTGYEAGRLLGGSTAVFRGGHAFSTDADPPFVGRHRELDALETALKKAGRGMATAVYVHGPSGIGKSALVHRFLDRAANSDDIVVLRGRCYEYESVPFNAFDGIIDNLSRWLSALPRTQAEPLLPPDLTALSRLFPVMLQVEPRPSRLQREQHNPDPVVLRQRAFTALRELLGRIAARQPLIVYIDDLHWADTDSAVLLEELLRQPHAPGLLVIACLRTEELLSKPFLRALVDRTGSTPGAVVPLAPMTDDEARALLAGAASWGAPAAANAWLQITRDAGGNPFLLRQLARYLATDPTRRQATFAEMLDEGVRALPPEGRRFLETLAICGRPIAPDIVCDACEVARGRQSLLARLRASHYIRSSGSSERVETYHDRIREAIAARIAPGAARRIHERMVQALIERDSDDCEALFEHYRGAGDDDNASLQAGLAAAKAGRALAFDRAAWFYREALALGPRSVAVAAWREGLAGALANAGQPAAAAEAYLRAAADAVRPHQTELQRRAAEQFLIAGDLDRGLDLTRTVLAGLGMRAPCTRRAALAWLLWRRARLRWRGLGFTAKPAGSIDSDTLLRIDTCWSAATGLALVDVIEASEFNMRALQMALDAGDPYRIARAMAIESAARIASPRKTAFGARLTCESKALAQRLGNPHALALSYLADGITAMMSGQFTNASSFSEQAVAILRDHCVGVTWELNSAQNLAVWALLYQGELGEASRRLPVLLARARSSGNLFVATDLCTRGSHIWLAADKPDEGERIAVDSIARWSHRGVHRQHYSAVLTRIQIALYRGDAERAWGLLDELESILRQTHLRRVQFMRIEACNLRGRSALAMAAVTRNSGRFRSAVRAEARRIARERMPWSDPIALMLQSGLAFLEGQTSSALSYLHDAADRFDRADMRLHAAAARRRIGALQGDAAGRELQRQAEAWMAAQQIKNLDGMTRLLAPGFPDVR